MMYSYQGQHQKPYMSHGMAGLLQPQRLLDK